MPAKRGLKLSRTRKAHGNGQGLAYHRSARQEKELATRVGGNVVKGSGRGMEKGDVRAKGILRVEAKTTTKGSFRVTRDMLDQIEAAGYSAGEIPIMAIEFISPTTGRPLGAFAIAPLSTLEELVEYGRRKNID